jgi:hypothetical protein
MAFFASAVPPLVAKAVKTVANPSNERRRNWALIMVVQRLMVGNESETPQPALPSISQESTWYLTASMIVKRSLVCEDKNNNERPTVLTQA